FSSSRRSMRAALSSGCSQTLLWLAWAAWFGMDESSWMDMTLRLWSLTDGLEIRLRMDPAKLGRPPAGVFPRGRMAYGMQHPHARAASQQKPAKIAGLSTPLPTPLRVMARMLETCMAPLHMI